MRRASGGYNQQRSANSIISSQLQPWWSVAAGPPLGCSGKTRKMTQAATIDGICFDLDGTLYLQPQLRRAMALRLFRNMYARPRAGYRMVRILSAYRAAQESLRAKVPDCEISEAQIRLTCEGTGAPREEVIHCIKVWFDEAPLPLLGRFMRPGLREFLLRAKARNLKLAVISDYPAAAKLAAMDLAGCFDVVVCAQDSDVQRFKPDPTGLQIALRRLRVEGDNALYVGDRPSVDGEAARLAGVRSVIMGDKGQKTDSFSQVFCADFTQLAAVVLQ